MTPTWGSKTSGTSAKYEDTETSAQPFDAMQEKQTAPQTEVSVLVLFEMEIT